MLYLPRLPLGGIERTTIALANHWAGQGRAVTLLLDRAEGVLLPTVRAPMATLNAPRTAAALPPLIAYLRRTRPALLHSALPWNNLVALIAGRLTKTPISIAEHSLIAAKTGAKARLLPPLMRLLYPGAHAIIAPSTAIARDLAVTAQLPRERIEVVGNPIIDGLPPASSRPRNPVPTFLAIGRLVPIKDFPTLLQAFRLVLDHAPARLKILGEGSERPALETLATNLNLGGALQMPGESDPTQALASADALVVSSRSEGFGNVVAEAMAHGTAVVSTRCGGPEELLDHGRLGALVPVGNPAALAAAMLAPIPGTPEARRQAAAAFTVAKVADRIWTALHVPCPS